MNQRRRSTWIQGRDSAWRFKRLSPVEFRWLRVFSEHPDTVLDREFLLDQVWKARSSQPVPDTIDKYVHRLRRKIGSGILRTRHSLGYMLDE